MEFGQKRTEALGTAEVQKGNRAWWTSNNDELRVEGSDERGKIQPRVV